MCRCTLGYHHGSGLLRDPSFVWYPRWHCIEKLQPCPGFEQEGPQRHKLSTRAVERCLHEQVTVGDIYCVHAWDVRLLYVQNGSKVHRHSQDDECMVCAVINDKYRSKNETMLTIKTSPLPARSDHRQTGRRNLAHRYRIQGRWQIGFVSRHWWSTDLNLHESRLLKFLRNITRLKGRKLMYPG